MSVRKAVQIFSRHVAMAFRHFREKPQTAALFKGKSELITILLEIRKIFNDSIAEILFFNFKVFKMCDYQNIKLIQERNTLNICAKL